MSKVLIDRAVLEATLEHAEFVSGAACDADDAIRSALSAPSGTPVMPVKAYYHESPNEYGGLNKSVGLEQRKTFADAPLVLESDALMQIACLEGEIAKRDARIVELESELVLRREDHYRMDAELAAIKAQEPVAWTDGAGAMYSASLMASLNISSGGLTPLYAAPVVNRKLTTECKRCLGTARVDIGTVCDNWVDCPECAAPAAPAAPSADAGLVEALEKLARLGNGDQYGNSDGNMIAQAALAAHRADPAPGGE